MGHSPDLGCRGHCSMDVWIDCENVGCGQMVFPLHFDWRAPLGFKYRAWILPLVSPESGGRQLRMQLLLELRHANAVLRDAVPSAVGQDPLWDWQRVCVPV